MSVPPPHNSNSSHSAKNIIELQSLTRSYTMGDSTVHALNQLNLSIEAGDYACIMGPSGCGKSTLLNILGCLDQANSGHYYLDGQDVSTLPDDELSQRRGKNIGFIFQSYNLIQQLTVLENIQVPMEYQGTDKEQSRARAEALASQVGLSQRLEHRPNQLSGGQQQRVAIARALANDPVVILADEATGNLDSKSGQEILGIFEELNQKGKTLIFVTHDEETAERGKRIIRLRDGQVETETRLR